MADVIPLVKAALLLTEVLKERGHSPLNAHMHREARRKPSALCRGFTGTSPVAPHSARIPAVAAPGACWLPAIPPVFSPKPEAFPVWASPRLLLGLCNKSWLISISFSKQLLSPSVSCWRFYFFPSFFMHKSYQVSPKYDC